MSSTYQKRMFGIVGVKRDGVNDGEIIKNANGKWRFRRFRFGHPVWGEPFETLEECKASLEKEQ